MSPSIATNQPSTARPIVYPDTDGLPMAENTKQYDAIVTIKENLERQFRDDPLVFIAADLFWYPEEGNNQKRTAPDVMVVFGVPKGHRSSYMQWVENGITPQVVFEVLSPGNRADEMANKLITYERQGVEEYYIFDPDTGLWEGWTRSLNGFDSVKEMHGWTSPRLQIKFEVVKDGDLTLYGSNGKRFLTMAENEAEFVALESDFQLEQWAREQATQRADEAMQRADEAMQRANEAMQRANEATQRANEATQRAETEAKLRAEIEQQFARLQAALKAAGINAPV